MPPAAPAAPPPGGLDDFQRLMAGREKAQKRNKAIFGVVALGVIGVVAFKMVEDRKKKAAAQEKLNYAAKFVTVEKTETGAFWNCAFGSEVDIGALSSTDQIQQRIEGAYATQQKTYSDHVVNECLPKIERAMSAANGLTDAPVEYQAAIAKYKASLPKLKAGIEVYAEKIKSRAEVKDVDKLIQDAGNAWHMTVEPSPEGVAFEKFMYCAIPDLDKKKDVQEVLEFLADTCYKKDPVAFMAKVREECGSLLTSIDKEAKPVPSKTWKASMKKFFEEDARQLQAWDSCARKSRKGKKVEDLEEFLVASGDYMEARHEVVAAAREIEAVARGEVPKPEGPAGAPPGAVPPPAAKKAPAAEH